MRKFGERQDRDGFRTQEAASQSMTIHRLTCEELGISRRLPSVLCFVLGFAELDHE